MALFPAELAKRGAQRGQSKADAALLSRTCRSSASSATTTGGPTSQRAALLATRGRSRRRLRDLSRHQSGAMDRSHRMPLVVHAPDGKRVFGADGPVDGGVDHVAMGEIGESRDRAPRRREPCSWVDALPLQSRIGAASVGDAPSFCWSSLPAATRVLDAGGCSAERATARCACWPTRIGRPQQLGACRSPRPSRRRERRERTGRFSSSDKPTLSVRRRQPCVYAQVPAVGGPVPRVWRTRVSRCPPGLSPAAFALARVREHSHVAGSVRQSSASRARSPCLFGSPTQKSSDLADSGFPFGGRGSDPVQRSGL